MRILREKNKKGREHSMRKLFDEELLLLKNLY